MATIQRSSHNQGQGLQTEHEEGERLAQPQELLSATLSTKYLREHSSRVMNHQFLPIFLAPNPSSDVQQYATIIDLAEGLFMLETSPFQPVLTFTSMWPVTCPDQSIWHFIRERFYKWCHIGKIVTLIR